MIALNVELRINDGSERRIEDATLNAKLKKDMMDLNTELETNNGFECQNKNTTLKVKRKMRYDGYECRTKDK